MIPRIVKRKTGVKDSATAQQPVDAAAVVVEEEAANGRVEASDEAEDEELLERLGNVLELCVSDFGLSWYSHDELLSKMEASGDDSVHLQHLLLLAPVRAVTDSIALIQRALLRISDINTSSIKLSDDKFRAVRTDKPEYASLRQRTQQAWIDSSVYLEHIPSLPGIKNTPRSLRTYFARLFDTKVHRVILPPLYDHATGKPSSWSSQPTDPPNSQKALFKQSIADSKSDKGKAKATAALPPDGGTFKGFAFVVLDSPDDAQRILDKWAWKRPFDEQARTTDDLAEGEEEGDGEDDDATAERVKMDHVPQDESLAVRWGLRAISYSRYLELQLEYLAYAEKLASLPDTSEASKKQYKNDRYARQYDYGDTDSAEARPDPRSVERWGKVKQRSPSPPRGSRGRKRQYDHESQAGASSSARWQHDRHDNASSSTRPTHDGDSEDRGAYPKGCIVWLRNVHPSSTRQAVKNYISELLEEREEASGTGVVYIQFEKGLDNAHVRFSSAHLSTLFVDTLAQNGPFYALPRSLTRDRPPSAMDEVEPVTAELVTGEKEYIYWKALPERARRGARKSAAGESELASVAVDPPPATAAAAAPPSVDAPAEVADDEEPTGANMTTEAPASKRKKPSKF